MSKKIAIIGGGPAGLFAAEYLSAKGHELHVFERKPSLARKLLMAGRGGLNLTHSEALETFVTRYEEAAETLSPIIKDFTPNDLVNWCEDLGQKIFIGSSGRIFPESFKASPLLRAWTARLNNQGVSFHLNHEWKTCTSDHKLSFINRNGENITLQFDAVLLALGGASWPKLGSNAAWIDILKPFDIGIRPFAPSNCGFKTNWSHIFSEKFAGTPLKNVQLHFKEKYHRGEIMFTASGIEGGAVYALSPRLRDALEQEKTIDLILDLKPDLSLEDIIKRLKKPRGKMSLTRYLDKTLNLENAAIGLLMERTDRKELGTYTSEKLAQIIKSYPLTLTQSFDIDRAISSAGGILFSEINNDFMLKKLDGVFVAGEMLDWEAPTGGYLLQATFATALHAAKGVEKYLNIK
jgi:hypothetical protein